MENRSDLHIIYSGPHQSNNLWTLGTMDNAPGSRGPAATSCKHVHSCLWA